MNQKPWSCGGIESACSATFIFEYEMPFFAKRKRMREGKLWEGKKVRFGGTERKFIISPNY